MSLKDFRGFAACGGFSYGDVLGAGEGWAKSILFNARAREEFAAFFERQDSFALGVCNGSQMMSNLHELIPGAERWPHFVRNRSEQFEARFVMLEVQESPSLFFKGMAGSRIPVAVAHGESYAEFADAGALAAAQPLVALRYVDNRGAVTEQYPLNPSGTPQGITGLTLKKVVMLSKQDAYDCGAVGPTARGSGVAIDMRETGYADYGNLNFKPIVASDGDCYARCNVRIQELFSSIDLIEQAAKKILRVPLI